ncbi:MAG: Gfo/Idh/MocA family oxidoreductase [Planctomycetia bacterium]|nr:Gfo/Idh/MocA family oxidoreductase [Planctomycetia bacterium]
MQDSRRGFLSSCATAAAAAAVTPYFFSKAHTLADETKSATDRVALGLIGAGSIAQANIGVAKDWIDVVAIADVDAGRAAKSNERYSQGKAAVYDDYRKILERKDVDVIHVATPDHWHTKPVVEAMLAGKDVYCEKPLTLTIDEGKLIRRIQQETGRIVQVGTQQRSTFPLFVTAMALVAEGRLGRIKRVQAAIGAAPSSPSIPVASVPGELNWDRWLGPAPAAEYRFFQGPAVVDKEGKEKRPQPNTNCHYEFRWWYEYSGGKLTDWGAHHVDIATWALLLNGQTAGPLSIGGTSKHPVAFKDGLPVERDRYNTATEFLFTVDFPGGTQMVIRNDTDNGILIEGEKGTIFVNRGKLTGGPVEALKDDPLPEGAVAKVYKNLPIEENERKAHWANFLYCAKNRLEPISDVHSHMKMLNICHLAGISARLGRSLKWDAAAEQIVGDEQANSMLGRPYRAGYEIEMG